MISAVAKDVTFTYRGAKRCSLEGINVHAAEGEVTLLCGASGSGKTSALRLFNGLIPSFHDGELSGRVRVGDLDVPRTPLGELAEVCATVFQNPRTQFYTTHVIQELAFGLENLGRDPAQIRERIRNVATQVRVEHLLEKRCSRLSGGQMQLVACAVALCATTPLIVFDEPTANLDDESIHALRHLIELLKAEGHTIVVAEHRLSFLAGIADRAYVFDKGRIVRQCNGEEFFSISDAERRELGLRSLACLPGAEKPAPTGPGLLIENLAFGYRRREPVLDIDHMLFPAGRVTALTGENGAGKTTLARLICGLERTRHGRMMLGDKPLKRGDAYLIMQDPTRQLFADTVVDEVTLGLKKRERAEADSMTLLEQLDLADHASDHPQALSGGQRQRLVIATAQAARRKIYIFDEPTSGVGYRHLKAISHTMRHLADSGAVVIVITHDQELIEEAADHVNRLGSS
ncbi:ABC transporter [Bowdeniella nasicola]|uniref:ABC transporter n=1 Tax=Bowdeniella nasicola TaxID=208480 RepID=A0A1Q5Q1B3_9ACTO|nr:ABC transporter ATP-binding protein [Bowdeniella nasicola]OKL53654.1 ABC transporter [Bowdeniella nasicola]